MKNEEKELNFQKRNGLQSAPLCVGCGQPVPLSLSSYKYQKFCSQSCYLKNKECLTNKSVKINGVIYESVKAATLTLKISRFKLLQHLYNPSMENFEFFPDHENEILIKLGELSIISPRLVDKHYLQSLISNRIPLKSVLEDFKCSLDTIRIAFCLFNIPTKHSQISEETSQKLKDKLWLEDEFKRKSSSQIASEIGCSPSLVLQSVGKHGIQTNRRITSFGESELADFVESLGIIIERNDRKQIYPKELDIFIPSMNIAIEYHGTFFHSVSNDLQFDKHKHRDKWEICRQKGIRLIQIFEDDWINKKDLVKRKISTILGKNQSPKIFARKCTADESTNSSVRHLHENFHIQGHKNCKSVFVLKYHGEIVASMSFNGSELERYVSIGNVIGGFSKLLKFAIRLLNLKIVETFADLCWSDITKNVYVKNGFVVDHVTSPGYSWVVNGKRESRIKYQKHKLTNMKFYDSKLSESEIMYLNGHRKLFDVGHLRLVLNVDKQNGHY